MGKGLLIDFVKCVGCGACTSACKEQNKLPETVDEKPTAYTWTTVQEVDGVFVRHLCMHCLEPTCASVCPVGALYKTPEGAVAYDAAKCMGCRYCMMACPFDVPRYQWDRAVPIIGKCILCNDRLAQGQPTACSEACAYDATVFGDRDQLIREARNRIQGAPESYVGRVYGLQEAGGTSVLMVSGIPFAQAGLKTQIPDEPPSMRTWQVLSKIPDFVAVWGAFLYGIHWITARRSDVAAEAHGPSGEGRGEGRSR